MSNQIWHELYVCVADVGALAQYERIRKDTWALAACWRNSAARFKPRLTSLLGFHVQSPGLFSGMTLKAGTCLTDTMAEYVKSGSKFQVCTFATARTRPEAVRGHSFGGTGGPEVVPTDSTAPRRCSFMFSVWISCPFEWLDVSVLRNENPGRGCTVSKRLDPQVRLDRYGGGKVWNFLPWISSGFVTSAPP